MILNQKSYDIAVIGSGAGMMVVEAAHLAGLRVALIEASKFGGTCLTKGCIPSKMLVYPADVIRDAAEAKRVGLTFAPPEIDWKLISSRMWRQINYTEKVEKSLYEQENLDVYKGFAEFTSPKTLRIKKSDGYEEIYAENIVIAAGAHSYIPDIQGLDEVGFITSETFFGDKYPYEKPWKSLAIIGSGAIAAEFAHILSAFGTDVTIISKNDRILLSEEEEISEFTAAQFEKTGIKIIKNAKTISASINDNEKQLVIEDTLTGQQHTIKAEEIFVAAGVRPYSDTLSLDKAGVATDDKGWIITDELLRTTQEGIYAIGDINGKHKFRHTANYEAEILINNLFTNNPLRSASYNSIVWAIFTHPQIAHLGITEREARAAGIDIVVNKNSYRSIAAGMAMGFDTDKHSAGFAKLISDGAGKLLGVHIVGPQAAVLIQPFVYLMNTAPQSDDMLDPIRRSMVIHPSLSELTAWAIDGL